MRFWVRGYAGAHGDGRRGRQPPGRRQRRRGRPGASSELLPIIQPELPGSVRITPIYDRSQSIVNSVTDVQETLLIAFVLVVVVIFLFLGRATDTLIPAVALPLSLLLTFIVMRLLGYSLDNLSLMALTLAIGFLVDDAIVFLENTVRRMEQRREGLAGGHRQRQGDQLHDPLDDDLAGGGVHAAGVHARAGRAGSSASSRSRSSSSIFASGVVSLTLTPLMCARLLKDRGHGAKKTWMERVIGGVEKRVLGVVRRTRSGGSCGTAGSRSRSGSSAWPARSCSSCSIPRVFLPPGDSGVIFGAFIGQEGSSPEQMRAIQDRVDEALHADPARADGLHADGRERVPPLEHGHHASPSSRSPKERPPIARRRGRADGQDRLDARARSPSCAPSRCSRSPPARPRRRRGSTPTRSPASTPQQVYETAGKLMAKLCQYPGFQTVIVGPVRQHAQPGHRHPARPGQDATASPRRGS